MLLWKDPPGQLGKERGGERTDRGEMKQDKQTAYLTLSQVRASPYWTKCRLISVLIFFTILSSSANAKRKTGIHLQTVRQTETSEISVGCQDRMRGPHTTKLPVQNPLTGQPIQIHQFKYYKNPQEILLSNVRCTFHR